MDKSDNAYKTIGEVAKILNLKTNSIKADNLRNKLVKISKIIKNLKNLK